MRKLTFAILMAISTTAAAQQIDLKALDKIAAKAKGSTEMGMDPAMLKAAASALNEKDGKEAAVKKLTENIKGFFLRNYEFKKGDFKLEDIKPLTDQLKAPNWVRFLHTKEDNEQTEIWWHVTNGETDGILLIAAEEDELTVINAVGTANLQDLSKLKDLGNLPK
jgi:uncharacterized protein DUF4252